MDTKKLILILLCIFLPPVAVYMEKGLNKDFFINLILTFFFLPTRYDSRTLVNDEVTTYTPTL